MGIPATLAKTRYNSKSYDFIGIRLKKGTKDFLDFCVKDSGKSFNQYLSDIIMESTERYVHRYQVISFLKECCNQFADELCGNLCYVVLYGSYARGDFRDSSDIDVLFLLNEDSGSDHDKILDFVTYCNSKLDLCVSQFVMEIDDFRSRDYGIYRNIRKEGVILYGPEKLS